MITVRLAELFIVFVIIKALWELWQNQKEIIRGKGVYKSIVHTYQHMAALVGIIMYLGYDLYSYWYFENHILYSLIDYSILVVNLIFQGILWLVVIDHFRQERINDVREFDFWDIFKF